MQRSEEALGIVHLDLAAVQRDGKIVGELVESGLVVAGAPMIRKSVLAPVLQGLGAGHGDAQCRKAGLAAEVAHEA